MKPARFFDLLKEIERSRTKRRLKAAFARKKRPSKVRFPPEESGAKESGDAV